MNDIPRDTSQSHSFFPGYMLRVNIKCCSNVTNVTVRKKPLISAPTSSWKSDEKRWVGMLLAFPLIVRDN